MINAKTESNNINSIITRGKFNSRFDVHNHDFTATINIHQTIIPHIGNFGKNKSYHSIHCT